MPFERVENGVRLRVKLTPKAARDMVGGIFEDADGAAVLKAGVTAAPEDGKANAALIKMLSKKWKIPKSAFSVISGATSRNKTLLIEGDPAALCAKLSDHLPR